MDYDYSNMNQKNNGHFLYIQNDNTKNNTNINIYQYSDKNNSYTTGKNNIYSLKDYNNQNLQLIKRIYYKKIMIIIMNMQRR